MYTVEQTFGAGSRVEIHKNGALLMRMADRRNDPEDYEAYITRMRTTAEQIVSQLNVGEGSI